MNELFSNIKTLGVLIAVAVIIGTVTFWRGCDYGEKRMDAKWRAEITSSKPVEVRRDTVWLPQKPYAGTFQPKTITVTEHNKKINEVVAQAMELTQAYANEVDSGKAINKRLTEAYIKALQPRLIELETPAIGKLILRYFPADSSLNVYEHTPPPEKVVTVYRERLVLEPRSDWEIAGYTILGAGIGALIYALAH